MTDQRPSVIVLAGPNGAGKSTAAPAVLGRYLHIAAFVNADVIARGLSGFSPDAAAIEAGAIMIERVRKLAEKRVNFAFETTLASRTFAPWLAGLVQQGYESHLFFLWLPTADVAVRRVGERVRAGGHGVPEETIRRRYVRGIDNFFKLYRPIATTWQVFDNSQPSGPRLIASGKRSTTDVVSDRVIWQRLCDECGHED